MKTYQRVLAVFVAEIVRFWMSWQVRPKADVGDAKSDDFGYGKFLPAVRLRLGASSIGFCSAKARAFAERKATLWHSY